MGVFTINNGQTPAVPVVLASVPVDGSGNSSWNVQGGFAGEIISMTGVLTADGNVADVELIPTPQGSWSGTFKFADLGLLRTKDILLSGNPGVYAEAFVIQNVVKVNPANPATVTFTVTIDNATSPIGSPSVQVITYNIP